MKKIILLCFFIAAAISTQAQKITIQISDNETKESIEFANILLPDHQKSFLTNEKGIFAFDTEKYKFPLKVIAQQFGFDQKEITLQNSTSVYNIYLTPTTELLQEIIIPPKNAKIKERTIGWNIIDVNDLDIYIDGHKKIVAIIKTLKVELNDTTEKNYLKTNVGFAASNAIVFKDSEFEDWMKIPMNYPFYITVDSYE